MRFLKNFLRHHKTLYPWMIWAGGMLFFGIQAMMRSLPNAISGQLQESLAISERNIALLGSCFYGAYAVTQIPAGFLIDYWGPKKVLVRGALLFSVGVFLFAQSDVLWMACIGRILTGFGGSVAFIGTVRLSAAWFTPQRLAVVIGITMGMGKLGGACVNRFPWGRYALLGWSWSYLLTLLSLGTVLLAIVLQLVLRDMPTETSASTKQLPNPSLTWHHQWLALKVLLGRRDLWATGLYAFFFYTFLTSFTDVFASSFLQKAYPGLASDIAGKISSWVLVGMWIGSPLISYCSNVFQTRRTFMQIAALALCSIVSFWATYVTLLPLWVSQGIFLICGVIMGAQALVFITTTERIPRHLSSTATGIVNTLNMMSGFFVPLFLKSFMELFVAANSFVSLREYQYSLYILCGGFFVAFLLTFYIPESFPKAAKSPE